MWSMLFQTIVAPILVGVVLALFTYWLDKRDDD
ncbi:type I toxin-antitoxin system Fst family toxin [Streptococcus henryi]|nr:type I toxin-antitoxin system Fst family toxin [Streptococcus henryi]